MGSSRRIEDLIRAIVEARRQLRKPKPDPPTRPRAVRRPPSVKVPPKVSRSAGAVRQLATSDPS